jgi:hypothetical protein
MADGSERYMPGPPPDGLDRYLVAAVTSLDDGDEIAVMASAEERSVADSAGRPGFRPAPQERLLATSSHDAICIAAARISRHSSIPSAAGSGGSPSPILRRAIPSQTPPEIAERGNPAILLWDQHRSARQVSGGQRRKCRERLGIKREAEDRDCRSDLDEACEALQSERRSQVCGSVA